jgi:hypothetical protein
MSLQELFKSSIPAEQAAREAVYRVLSCPRARVRVAQTARLTHPATVILSKMTADEQHRVGGSRWGKRNTIMALRYLIRKGAVAEGDKYYECVDVDALVRT